MADVIDSSESGASENAEPTHEDRLESIIERFERADRKAAAAESDDDAGEGSEGDDSTDDSTDDQSDDEAEHTDSDTESASDGDADETDDDSDETDDKADDDSDDTDDQNTESDDDEEDDAADNGEEDEDEHDDDDAGDDDDEEESASEDTRAALSRHGADLSIDDVPAKYRGLITSKLKKLDAGFTRAMQEARSFRAEQAQLRTERHYLLENTDLAIVELLEKGGPDLMKKVNARLNKLDPTIEGNDDTSIADNKAVLDEVIKTRKRAASEAVVGELNAAEATYERAVKVEEYARTAAQKAGLEYTPVMEELILKRITDKGDKRHEGLTNREIDDVVSLFKKDRRQTDRKQERDSSKQRVRDRKDFKRNGKNTVRPPKNSSSPGSTRPKKVVVDHNDQESRLAAMEKSARRIIPGARAR